MKTSQRDLGSPPPRCDVLIAGGGPAGAAAGGILALLGHRVVILEETTFPREHIGESLTPKVEPLLDFLGVREAVRRARFVRMPGTTEIWRGGEVRSTPFADGAGRRALGYQVDRARFDAILLERARALGAEVREGTRAEGPLLARGRVAGLSWSRPDGARGETRARITIDASGQRGILARRFRLRRPDPIASALAVGAYWEGAGDPPGADPRNTYLEAFEEGILWSVPLAGGLRNATMFLERHPRGLGGGPCGLERFYRERIAKTRARAFLRGASLIRGPSLWDASWYSAARASGPGFFLVGDAASFVDPLSSQGVFKALHTAIAAAAAANTCLRNPGDEAIAREYLDREEDALVREYATRLSLLFGLTGKSWSGRFWRDRARPHPLALAALPPSFDERRRRRQILDSRVRDGALARLRFRAIPGCRWEERPYLERGQTVRRAPMVVTPWSPRGLPVEPRAGIEILLRLLDGSRTVEGVLEQALRGTGTLEKQRKQGRLLLETIVRLHLDGALDLESENGEGSPE